MSGVRSSKTNTEDKVEETAVESAKVSDLVKQGFVLEVTAREPDVRDKKNNIISKGKIFDRYHHPCNKKDCTHDVSTVGKWVLVPASDESRCVN